MPPAIEYSDVGVAKVREHPPEPAGRERVRVVVANYGRVRSDTELGAQFCHRIRPNREPEETL